MVEAIRDNNVSRIQQTLRSRGAGQVLVVKPGQLQNLKGIESLSRLPNLHRELTDFIGSRLGIKVTDILCDAEGKIAVMAANPAFIERIKNANGDLGVLGHRAVWEMADENSGKLYLLKNESNVAILNLRDIPRTPAHPPKPIIPRPPVKVVPPPKPIIPRPPVKVVPPPKPQRNQSPPPSPQKQLLLSVIDSARNTKGFEDKWEEFGKQVEKFIAAGISTRGDLLSIISYLSTTNKGTREGQTDFFLHASGRKLRYEMEREGKLPHPVEKLYVLEQDSRKLIYTYTY